MQSQRHAVNRNLTIYNGSTYRGLPLMVEKGPFILEYLERLYQTTMYALEEYRTVFAFRFDLYLPSSQYDRHGNEVITRFFESVKEKIKHKGEMARRQNPYAHTSTVRYVWTREHGQSGDHHHYHCVLLLNKEAFSVIGKFEAGRDNMFNRLQQSWASALGLPFGSIAGLVNFPDNPDYKIQRGDNDSLATFFHRVSYLCKARTKIYGDGHHGFGTSKS